MTNKHTKKALLSSALALILCFAMLVGTTFAWFTDSVTSGKNIIQAGNLDVALEYSTDLANWKDVQGVEELFSGNLWEPGHTEVMYLKLSNEGTLALKYRFAMTFEDTVVGKTADGAEIKLSEHLKYDIVNVTEAFASRDAAREAVKNTAQQLSVYSVNGQMTADAADKTMALVVYMDESVGNEANYRGEAIPQIDLGISLFATQETEESDSFGIDYDAGAFIEDDAALKDALTENKETIIVNLTSDVTWDAAAWDNNAMGGELTKTIAINGNGHTITFNNTNSDWTNIVTGDAVLIIENATITNSGYDATSGTWNGHDITFKNEVKLNNVTLLNAIALMDDATLTNVNLTDDSSGDAYGIWIRPNGQTVSIDGLTMDMTTSGGNDRGIKIDNQYAEADDKGVTLNVKNSSFKTEKKSAILVKSTGAVAINLENINISGVAEDSINAVWVDEDVKDNADNIVVTGGNKVIEGSVKVATPETVEAVINGANAGDQIQLRAGTYETIVAKSNITIIGTPGAEVGFLNVNGSKNVTLKNITFDAAAAVMTKDGKGKDKQYANIAGASDSTTDIGAHNLVIEDCIFSGTFTNGGAAIAFVDQNRTSGQSGNITITGCEFNTTGSYYDIYAHYSGSGNFVIENNTFASEREQGLPIYLGRYQSGTPVVVKGNTFMNVTTFEDAAYIQDHSSYGVSFDASGNTFAA